MKSSASDSPAWDGTNSSGFSGLAGGYRNYDGGFYSEGNVGYFWSASAVGAYAWSRTLYGGYTGVSRGTTTSGTVFQFVAFGIKNVGLWGA